MKRIFFSLFLSFFLLILLITSSAVLEFYFLKPEAVEKLAMPFRLPGYLYTEVLKFQFTENLTEDILFVLAAALFNILLYGLIFYFLITLLSKIRGNKKPIDKIEIPPEPPVFNKTELDK